MKAPTRPQIRSPRTEPARRPPPAAAEAVSRKTPPKEPPPEYPPRFKAFRRDYVGIAYEYALQAAAEENKGRFGRWIRLAAQRFLNDLSRALGPAPPFLFDPWHACDPCDFIEKLPHVEGTWKDSRGRITPTIVLHASDVFFLVQLFGFRTHEGHRRFTVALKAVARKNAKSTIAAGIGLYCETCEGEMGPQVISAATTGQQARIVFNIAKRMAEMTEPLRSHFLLSPFSNAIACFSNGGTFKPINAKASSQDGLNPSTAIIDEVHAHKNHDLINVVQSAAGARSNPLFLYTTTEGYESPGPWPELRHFAQQVLLGIISADHFLCLYFSLDDEDKEAGIEHDDDFDETKWVKANPLMECNPILLQELKKAAIDARHMPGKLAEFRIKRLNRRSSVAKGFINYSHWKKGGGPIDLDLLREVPCWGGLDLASTTDIAAFRLVWMLDGVLYTWGKKWVPESCVSTRSERGTVPYAGWVAAGYLTQTPGEVIDYSIIERDILELCSRFNLQRIAYDIWNAAQLAKKLKEAGVSMKAFLQGPKSYHPAMKAFEELYISGRFRHNDDPVLLWCAANTVVRYDVQLNRAPDRKRSFEKIDDMVALLMAYGQYLLDESRTIEPTLAVL